MEKKKKKTKHDFALKRFPKIKDLETNEGKIKFLHKIFNNTLRTD